MTDWDLLQRYVNEQSREALGELVGRHLDMVYGTALREVRDGHLAEDVTQAVFLTLMRQAGRIGPRVVVGGWLFKVTRYAAADARKARLRRQRREREAASMTPTITGQDVETLWPQVEPLLNEAIASLPQADRSAVVMKYLEGKSHAEVAAALGGTENVARQRLFRALEKVRLYLARRGVAAGETGLTAALVERAAPAAPAIVTQRVTAAVIGGTGFSTAVMAISKGAMHMAMRAKILQGTMMTAAALVLAVGGIWIATTVNGQPPVVAGDKAPGAVVAPASVPVVGPVAATAPAATQAVTPLAVVKAAWNAATGGKEDEFIACFDQPADDAKAGLRKIVRGMAAGKILLKAYEDTFKEPMDPALAAMMTFGVDPAVLTTAQETVDGDMAVVDVGHSGPGNIPLVKVNGTWKISMNVFDTFNWNAADRVDQAAAALKQVAADIKAGKLATAADATAAVKKLVEAMQGAR